MAEAKTITILDVEFPVTMPYDTGHVCTEAEAKALNQTRRENLGNNFRAKVKAYQDGEAEAMTLEELQAAFAEADKTYEFTIANVAASRKLDPVEREARKLAREYLKSALDAEGIRIGTPAEGYDEESWKDWIESKVDEIAADEQIVKIAKDTVKQRDKLKNVTLGGLNIGSGEAGQPQA